MYILFYTLAVLIWGTDAAITKRFLFNSIDPAPMLAIRLAVAGLTLLPFAARELPALRRLQRKHWVQLAVLIVAGTLGMNLFYYQGLTQTPAFITLILFRLEPVFVILISAVFLGQRTRGRTLLLTAAAIACGAAVSVGGSGDFSMAQLSAGGVFLVLLASVCSAVGIIVAKDLLAVISPILLTALRTSISSVVLLLWLGRDLAGRVLPALPRNDLLLVVFMGAVYSGIAFWLYYKGLKATQPLVASLIQLLRIVSGLLASFVLLQEIPNAVQWVGTLGLMATLYFITRPEPERGAEAPQGARAA